MSVFLYIPNLIGYGRILLLLVSLLVAQQLPLLSMALYFTSSILDALDGYAARVFNQSSQFGAVLDMVTDRSATSMLLLQLCIMYPQYLFVFQLLVGLDLSSHYMHIVASSKQGHKSHKDCDSSTPTLMKLYYTNKIFLFSICGGNEVFFICLYGLRWFPGMLLNGLLVATFPVFLFKQIMNVIQLVNASVQLAEQDKPTKPAKPVSTTIKNK